MALEWNRMLQKLIRYKNKHGTTNVDQKHNIVLYSWTNYQNQSKHNCTMEQGHIEKLNQINFEWIV